MKDLAYLQAWLKAAVPCALEANRAAILAAEGEPRRRLLRETYEACKGWPLALGTTAAWEALATPGGLRYFLTVLLGKWNPGFDDEAAGDLLARLTVAEHAALNRVAFAAHPLDELARLIDPEIPERPDRAVNWGKAAKALIDATGWTFAQVGELYLSQLIAYRTDGEPDWGEIPMAPGRTLAEEARRRRKLFYGEDGESIC